MKYEERPGEGNYRVNVTLEGNLTAEEEVEIHDEWYSIDIDIRDDPDPEEKIEIEVEIV